jgi:hypothetical protein
VGVHARPEAAGRAEVGEQPAHPALRGPHAPPSGSPGRPRWRPCTNIPARRCSTAEIQLTTLADGTISLLKGFPYTAAINASYDNETDRTVQVDPATRTGWTFGPGAREIRQFGY